MIAGCETNFIRVLDRKRRASIWWPERKAEARKTAKLNPRGHPPGFRPRYTRAFGDGPRNFEPWSSDVTTPELAPPLLTTTPHQREVSALDRFNVHRCPTRRVFSGTGLELRDKASR
ncbi:hypothetical protein TNCV_520101 [Trichonephila clavipes]|nr:hypothetical protein TNCV_520101 [Trichonephila clavipes]